MGRATRPFRFSGSCVFAVLLPGVCQACSAVVFFCPRQPFMVHRAASEAMGFPKSASGIRKVMKTKLGKVLSWGKITPVSVFARGNGVFLLHPRRPWDRKCLFHVAFGKGHFYGFKIPRTGVGLPTPLSLLRLGALNFERFLRWVGWPVWPSGCLDPCLARPNIKIFSNGPSAAKSGREGGASRCLFARSKRVWSAQEKCRASLLVCPNWCKSPYCLSAREKYTEGDRVFEQRFPPCNRNASKFAFSAAMAQCVWFCGFALPTGGF